MEAAGNRIELWWRRVIASRAATVRASMSLTPSQELVARSTTKVAALSIPSRASASFTALRLLDMAFMSVEHRPPPKAVEFLLIDDRIVAHRELDRAVLLMHDGGAHLGGSEIHRRSVK